MKRILALVAFLLAMLGLSSCATSANRPLTCALIVIRDGKQVVPTAAEFARIESKLAADLMRQGFVLVSDIVTADRLLTIVDESKAGAAGFSDLRTMDIAKNTFTPVTATKRPPDLQIGASQSGNFDAGKLGIPRDQSREYPRGTL